MSTPNVNRDSSRDGEAGVGSVCFIVTKPVLLHALGAEIATAHGWSSQPGLLVQSDPALASPGNPITIWALHSGLVASTVSQVITAHQGMESANAVWLDLKAKAAANTTLHTADLQMAVRLLLMKGI